MKKGWIDTEVVSNKYKHTGKHSVEYYLYHDERCGRIYIPKDPQKEFTARRRMPICFSAFPRELHREKIGGKRYNRICYRVIDDLENSVHLTVNEKKEWIKIARKHKLLPPYVRLRAAKDGKMVLDLEKCTPAQAYGYLATFRFIREDPGFVRAMVYLVNELKVNFYAAYVLCHKVCLTHGGHTVVNSVRPYMGASQPENVALPINQMIGLYRFFRDPTKYDKRNMYWNTNDFGGNYSCCSMLSKISKVQYTCKAKDLFDPELIKAIKSSSDEEANKYLEKIKSSLARTKNVYYGY